MTLLVVPDKITARHRERSAVVYVRQSSPHQVQHNRESQANQYALVQRAMELGWVPKRVRVFDADLATSGQDSLRADFRELVAEVSLGHVGLKTAPARALAGPMNNADNPCHFSAQPLPPNRR